MFFFINLSKGTQKAKDIWEEIKLGNGRLIAPTIVIVEVKKRLLSYGLSKYADDFVEELEASQKVSMVDLTLNIAKKAGTVGNSYKCTTPDAVILTTAVETGYDSLISDGKHFIPAEKHGKIKLISCG